MSGAVVYAVTGALLMLYVFVRAWDAAEHDLDRTAAACAGLAFLTLMFLTGVCLGEAN